MPRQSYDDMPYADSDDPAEAPPGGPPVGGDGSAEAPDAADPHTAMEEVDEPTDADVAAEFAADAEDVADHVHSPTASDDLTVVAAQRDEYLDQLRRVQADFENYRKRQVRQQSATTERAAELLVDKLLPVLDAVEAARGHHTDEVGPLWDQLLDVLTKEGLEHVAPEGEPFDPNRHEAVMHEEGDGDETTVLEVLRSGYVWKGRVLRPAMVKVSG